jgi:DNA/RNA-binding protein KIN17
MLVVGEDPKKYIEQYSRDFQHDFLRLLRTSHGEKKVHMNQFYQEYIRDKEHIHMNATKWPSLTEFAKYLGREGICRVEEGERGLEIQWIDDSPEAVQRREDIKRKEKLMKGDEDMEARMLERQIKQAREAAEKAGKLEEQRKQRAEAGNGEAAAEPVKVSLSLAGKASAKKPSQPPSTEEPASDAPVEISTFSSITNAPAENSAEATVDEASSTSTPQPEQKAAVPPKISLGGSKPKSSNPLMAKKSNPLSSKGKGVVVAEPEKKMSNAERIMREEMERKRKAEEKGRPDFKKQRT